MAGYRVRIGIPGSDITPNRTKPEYKLVASRIPQLNLEERDWICYLFDCGDKRRFFRIHVEIKEDEPSDMEPKS